MFFARKDRKPPGCRREEQRELSEVSFPSLERELRDVSHHGCVGGAVYMGRA